MQMAAIEMKNIVKKYGDGFPAVNDVSIDVADGEFMILVGPSGCGKSTLLRMIVGLEDITSGDMVIGGERVNDLAPRDRNLAMVFQNYALYPHLTVYENIAFPLRLAKGVQREGDRREGPRRGARRSSSTSTCERKPGNLSGGQRQRVAMGRAIVRDAEAFLFDEPLSNLDAKLRGQMRTEISRLQKRLGITTVYVTHDQTEAMTLGDRVAVLKRGRPAAAGHAAGALRAARSTSSWPGFIGSPPMNFLPATVEGNKVELPFGTVEIRREKAEKVAGQGPADRRHPPGALRGRVRGRRPSRARLHVPRHGRRRRVARQRGLRLHPVRGAAGGRRAARPARAGPRRRVAAHPARRLARRRPAGSQEGEEAEICVDPEQMHLFDPATGDNLTLV